MNMIEKVARAIDEVGVKLGGGRSCMNNPEEKHVIMELAKTAITAMLEPTEEMLQSGVLYRPNAAYTDECKEMFQVMIRKALEE